MSRESGYSSVTVLILILFLSTVTLGVISLLRLSISLTEKTENKYLIEEQLEEEVRSLISVLAEDPTPEADSIFDPVWSFLQNRDDSEIELSLEDISSRFNLNYIRTNMLEKSQFKSLMESGFNPEDLKLYRGENGFYSDLKNGYGQYFSEDVLEKYFTAYSYANFNITYEDSLKKIYEFKVSEEGSSTFLQKVQDHISRKNIADKGKLKEIFGADFPELYPLVNTEPLLNVNLTPEKILDAVLHYPYGGETHKNGSSFYEIIIAERKTFEFDPERLETLLGDLEDDYLRISQYLGTRTWFWKIIAVKNDKKLEVIICLLPESDDIQERTYTIIRWKGHND